MNTIPERIFLQWFGDETDPNPDDDIFVSDVSWNLERVFDADIEYRRANAAPTLEAQLAEALCRLQVLAIAAARIVEEDAHPTIPRMRELDRQRRAASEFLAKVKP